MLPTASACSLQGGGTGTEAPLAPPTDSPLDDAGSDGLPTGAVQPTKPTGWISDSGLITFPVDAGLRPPSEQPVDRPPAKDQDAGMMVDGSLLGGEQDAQADAEVDAGEDAQVGSDAGDSDAGPASDAAVPACTPDGTYALQLDFEVQWPPTFPTSGRPVLAAGTGTFSLQVQLTVSSVADTHQALLAPCGIELPELVGAPASFRDERYRAYALDSVWDSPAMPRWSAVTHASCASAGCSFAVDSVFGLLGATVTGVDGSGNPVGELADHDGDGWPSITFQSRTPLELSSEGEPYAYLPVGTVGRVRKQLLGFLFMAQLQGAFEACSALRGSVEGAYLEQHAVGCTGVVHGSSSEVACDASAAATLSATYPIWTVRRASFFARRITEPTCQAVRAALR